MSGENSRKESGFADAALKIAIEKGADIEKKEINDARERWSQPLPPYSEEIPKIDMGGKPFSKFFRVSKKKEYDYYIRYAYDWYWSGLVTSYEEFMESGCGEVFLGALVTGRKYGRTKEELLWDSPMHAVKSVERTFTFLDGGFAVDFGNSFTPHGAWVWGRKAIRFLCYELNIAQRRRWEGEDKIMSHGELLREIGNDKTVEQE